MPGIKIGPIVYTTKYTDGDKLNLDPDWDDPDDGASYYGAVSHSNQVVFLNRHNTEEREKLALLHEVLHAVSDLYDAQLHEGQVKCVSAGLMQVINDNKWFRKKLCEE